MKMSEWKAGLEEKGDAILDAYKELKEHLDNTDKIIEKFDPDELGAYLIIKLGKLTKKVERSMD